MTIRMAMANEADERLYGKILKKAIDNGNVEVLKFMKQEIFPLYERCGKGWEPADLDKDIVAFFGKI